MKKISKLALVLSILTILVSLTACDQVGEVGHLSHGHLAKVEIVRVAHLEVILEFPTTAEFVGVPGAHEGVGGLFVENRRWDRNLRRRRIMPVLTGWRSDLCDGGAAFLNLAGLGFGGPCKIQVALG